MSFRSLWFFLFILTIFISFVSCRKTDPASKETGSSQGESIITSDSASVLPDSEESLSEESFGEEIPEDEGEGLPEDSVFDQVDVQATEDNEKIMITLYNKNPYRIIGWSLRFNSDIIVKEAENATIVSNHDIILLDAPREKEVLASGESFTITLISEGSLSGKESFEVHGDIDELENSRP